MPHTPSPWVAAPQTDGSAVVVHRCDVGGSALKTRLICHVHVNKESPSEGKANIALITEAPTLLWALKSILRDLPRRRDWLDPDLERIAKEAIMNAEPRI